MGIHCLGVPAKLITGQKIARHPFTQCFLQLMLRLKAPNLPPMNPLRAIVTGGATNIGLAITEALLAGSGRVAVGQPDPAVAAPLVRRHGDRVIPLLVDVGEPGQCRKFVDEAAALLGGVDILVNNAAITGPGSGRLLAEIDPAHVDLLFRVNVGGVLFCSQAAVPHLRRAGGGVIVNIASINGFWPQRGSIVYAATKAAVISLTKSMAKEVAGDKIRVVAVAPGDIRIDKSEELEREMKARGIVSDVANQTPLGRGRPQDIADVVAFLCSDGARFVTGTTWTVDGGLLA
jgi:NAD(P)-dependent dehydrogenase (short-subunit alcohol dehydrogenase family)